MKYFLDTEFIEGTQKGIFNTKPTIDLISIGIVCEDGREYYVISKDFNLKEAWNRYDLKPDIVNGGMKKVYWLRDTVLKPIWEELRNKQNAKRIDFEGNSKDNYFSYNSLKYLIKKYGKTNKQIAEEVIEFCYNYTPKSFGEDIKIKYQGKRDIQFYGYYSDYDWVVFCWLFGKMIDLPKGFPMYCIDLQQTLDEKAWKTYCNNGTLNSETSLKKRIEYLKGESNNHLVEPNKPKFPKQTNKHNALSDARFNYELYKFLNII